MLFSKADLPQKPPKPAASGSSAQTTRIARISIAQTPTIPLPFMSGTRRAVHNKLYFRIPVCSETLCSSSMDPQTAAAFSSTSLEQPRSTSTFRLSYTFLLRSSISSLLQQPLVSLVPTRHATTSGNQLFL